MARKPSSSELIFNYASKSSQFGRTAQKKLDSLMTRYQTEIDDPKTSPRRLGEIALSICEMLHVVNQNIADSARVLIKPRMGDGATEPADAPSADDVMKALIHGTNRKP